MNERWIGSSAYCTYYRTIDDIIAVAGTTTLNAGGLTYFIDEIINHEAYFPGLNLNDVSLLHTDVSIIFTAAVGPIALSAAFVGGGINARGPLTSP